MVTVFCVQRPYYAGILETLGHLGHEFGNIHTRSGGLDGLERASGYDTRFWIPSFQLAGSTGQPQ